jgi:formate hydrogenlyase transcriptional activator
MCQESELTTQSRLEVAISRYQALFEMAHTLAHQGSLPDLLRELHAGLNNVVVFDLINFSLYDESQNNMLLNLWQGPDSPVLPMHLELDQSLAGWVWQNQEPIIWSKAEHGQRFPNLLEVLRSRGIQSYFALPLSTPQRRLGTIGFGTIRANAFGQDEADLLSRAALLVALAMDNTLTRQALREEKERLRALVEVNNSLTSSLSLQDLFPVISKHMGKVVAHDFASVDLHEPENSMFQDSPGEPPGSLKAGPQAASSSGAPVTPAETTILRPGDLMNSNPGFAQRMREAGVQALYRIPLVTSKGVLGTLNVGRKEERGFSTTDRELLHQVAKQLAIVLENARAYREIAELKNKLTTEKLYLEDEIRTELNFEEIVGESSALKNVLAHVRTVARSDATVLILGETGTGKELIARAIHNMSERKKESFVKLNCAAIPTGLLESELFGHEKGAFTGAITQKVGRMEVADGGTLFLDEIGEIPLELQPKLLRVVQDHEFERLGSNRTLRVNVRLLAATNRNLAKSVSAHEFRSDLYYRLNVFPVHVPPLRERREDIPLLVRYFVQRLAQRMKKPIQTIPTETMTALVNWDWPGNVRELENFLERSVILSNGSVLKAPLAELTNLSEEGHSRRDASLHTAERDHILRVLRETGGVISGTRGAAARLGLKRTTLQSKMQKLGISRQDFEN